MAERVKEALSLSVDPALVETADPLTVQRARKLANFFSQPFFCAEPWTNRPGSYESLKDSLQGCREIRGGIHDDLPVDAFYFKGGIEEIRGQSGQCR
jgi:F-type H+-transporting ATPase subunit beta